MTASLSPPFPPQAMEQWQQQQQQVERAIRRSPWPVLLPALLQQTAAYSSPSARAGRLWEGQALILHGATNDPLEVEQFGLVVKLGRFICSQPGYSAQARANDRKCGRLPLARRLLADVKRLRQWMQANPPAAPLWAPCCGQEGRRLALLLGLRVIEHNGADWAAWLPEVK